MLRSVYLAALWERRTSTIWWLVSLLLLTAWIVAFYPAIRDSAEIQEFIADFPLELLSLFGIDPELFTTGFGYLQAQLYSLIGPVIVIGLCIGIGAAATAAEEERGTMDQLLSTPTSRRRVVADKAAGMATLALSAVATMVLVLVVADPIVDLRLTVAGIVAINLGLLLLGLFFGSFAMVVGAWRGSRSLAAGLATVYAVVAWFANGFAPIVDWLDAINRYLPFSWYLKDDPLKDGPTLYHLLLAGGVALFVAAAMLLFQRRDIGTRIPLFEPPRWGRTERAEPAPRRGRLDGMLGGVFGTTLWERRVSIWWWLIGIGSIAALTIAFWPSVGGNGDSMQALLDAIPTEMLAMFGITDVSSLLTPEGFLSARLYATIGVILMLVFSIGAGTAALAGEEQQGTMDLLLGTPTPRDRISLQKLAAIVALVAFLMTGLLVVVVVAGLAVDMSLNAANIAAANAGLGLLALFFGSMAMAVGATTGRTGTATGVAAGLAVFSFVLNGFGAVLDWLAPFRWLSPFFWFLRDSSPASRGLTPSYLLLLAGVIVFGVATVMAFRSRDIGT